MESAVAQCEATLKAKADTSPEALKKLVDAFGRFGITKDQIEKRIQRRLDTITPAQLVNLRKIYNSLKDGMSGVADWFDVDPVSVDKGSEALKNKLKGKKKEEEPPKEEESKPEELVACPDKSAMVPASECVGCKKREGCPAHE